MKADSSANAVLQVTSSLGTVREAENGLFFAASLDTNSDVESLHVTMKNLSLQPIVTLKAGRSLRFRV